MTNTPSAATIALPVAPCQALLDAFLNGPCDINAALLSTADGRLVAVARRIEFEPARIAAIAGSILALAEACARELKQTTCRNAIVDSEHGLTVMLRVATPQGAWALTTIGARHTSLGLLFTHSKQLAETLAAVATGSEPKSVAAV
jgi:predicted regulator of Ras-like GTPase activity (Roadblock/LC7/MglB family)